MKTVTDIRINHETEKHVVTLTSSSDSELCTISYYNKEDGHVRTVATAYNLSWAVDHVRNVAIVLETAEQFDADIETALRDSLTLAG